MEGDEKLDIPDFLRRKPDTTMSNYVDSIRKQAQSELLSTLRPKDHEIAQCVNNLTKIAKEFGHTQQLREHISKEVLNLLNQLKD